MAAKTLAVVSMKGGTGRTTITAELGAALQEVGHACLLVDADPQNALGLLLGMPVGERVGLAHAETTREAAQAYLQRPETRVPHLPFGSCALPALLDLARRRLDDPTWLGRRLRALAPASVDLILIDTPAGPSAWAEQAVAEADLVLVVLLPDAASYATLPMTEAALDSRAGAARYVLNQMDPRRPLALDVAAAMEHVLGDRQLDEPIPADEAVREAFAQQAGLAQHAPDSQALAALRTVARRIEALLDATPDATGGRTEGDVVV